MGATAQIPPIKLDYQRTLKSSTENGTLAVTNSFLITNSSLIK